MQTRLRILRNFGPEIVDQDFRERRIIMGDLNIDWKVFKKSKAEKLQLKVAKAQAKLDEMRHNGQKKLYRLTRTAVIE